MAKAPFVAAFVRALEDSREKVLLFAHHHAVMDIYRRELAAYRPVFITGRESTTQKEEAVARFMEGKTNLCVISLRAASGLNLQRASCVVFGELDWSPPFIVRLRIAHIEWGKRIRFCVIISSHRRDQIGICRMRWG